MMPLAWMRANRWSFAALGVLILWGALSITTQRFSLQSLSGVASSASFLAIVAVGQMFVVASGGGNIDLSIPSVITLSAFISIILSGGTDQGLIVALPAVLAMGMLTGAVNALLVLKLRIPAIIATLAVGYVLDTATLLANRSFSIFAISPLLRTLASARVSGIPTILIFALVIVIFAAAVLGRTSFGRMLLAIGQNSTAAYLAGAKVDKLTAIAFLVSGALAAVDGALLSAYSGGAFLQMGQPYLLQSVGAVVIGGTLIFGGNATAVGTMFGSVLLVLVVTTMQIGSLPPGLQDIVQGLIIIAILAAAGSGLTRRAA